MPDEVAAVGQAGERIGVGELVLPFKAAGVLDRGGGVLGEDVQHVEMVLGHHAVAHRIDRQRAQGLRAVGGRPAAVSRVKGGPCRTGSRWRVPACG